MKRKTAKKKKTRQKRVKREASKESLIASIESLERNWPADMSREVSSAFDALKASLQAAGEAERRVCEPVPAAPQWPATGSQRNYFNLLDCVRKVLVTQDLLFLSRQITYHISASNELPSAYADPEQIRLAVSMLIEHMVRRSVRSGGLNINLREFALRGGSGIELSFEVTDGMPGQLTPEMLFKNLFGQHQDDRSGVDVSDCRQLLLMQGGQLWASMPKPDTPMYHMLIPASEAATISQGQAHQVFKYDISITNYANVRKRFGIKKSLSLVSQIEHYVQSLVRYPIDMVMAITDRGIITTIYETQTGAEQSVASRISQRLGREEFKIGKRPVDLNFHYQLTPLIQSQIRHEHDK